MFQKPILNFKPLKVKGKKQTTQKKKSHPSKDSKKLKKSNLRPRFFS